MIKGPTSGNKTLQTGMRKLFATIIIPGKKEETRKRTLPGSYY